VSVTDEMDKFRALLKAYDNGESSAGMCLSDIRDLVLDPFLDALEKGEEVMAFGSCCCSSHPPTRTFDVHFTIKPHGYVAKRAEAACQGAEVAAVVEP
jgi:hypothetical protein